MARSPVTGFSASEWNGGFGSLGFEAERAVSSSPVHPAQVSAAPAAPGPAASIATLANYLSSGYWNDTDRSQRYFNMTDTGTGANNGVLYYNMSGFSNIGGISDTDGISTARRAIAREAFDFYEAILGINFVETTSQGDHVDIFFKDTVANKANSQSTPHSGTGGPINYNIVNVSTDWTGGNSNSNDYLLQTFIHELGHSLGLGHQGNYDADEDPSYADSAIWANDCWQLSIMSYWSPAENTAINASSVTLISAMAVDVLALNTLYAAQGYGTVANAYTGNTIWGFGTNISGNPYANLASWADENAFCIIDGAGIDTVDFSNFSASQRINLTVALQSSTTGTVSDVGGLTGNMTLATGVVIENANGGSGADTITGNQYNNVLHGNGGNDMIYGGAGSGDTIFGDANNDTLYGQGGIDTLYGGDGNDTLIYETNLGYDNFYGGNGTDTAHFGSNDEMTIDLMAGVYRDPSSPNYAASSIEIVIAGSFSDTITGGAGTESLYGYGGADMFITASGALYDNIYGGDGNDTLDNSASGFAGDTFDFNLSTYTGTGTHSSTPTLALQSVETYRDGSGGNTIVSDGGGHTYYGNGGADVMISVFGGEHMYGGEGPEADTIDHTRFDGNYFFNMQTGQTDYEEELYVGFEIALMGDGNDTVVGTSFANDTIDGGLGNDVLDGWVGADHLYGAGGNDTYYVDNAGDAVTEASNEGTDIVYAKVSYALSGNQSVETLQLDISTGTQALNISGNAIGNVLTGNAGANVLNGGAGADLMQGGSGNDSYVVENVGDVVRENANAGVDTVVTTVSYALSAGQHVEVLQLSGSTGSTALSLTGNEFANSLIGNAGSNALQGLAGADVLQGGGGRDILVPGNDTAADIIRFNAIADSTGGNRDQLLSADFNNEDKLDFLIRPTVFAGNVTTGALNNGPNFNIEIANAVNALLGAGGAIEAVLFDPSSGGLNQPGYSYLVVDANNDGSYTANNDYLVELVNFAGTLDATDFI